jgi:hypothetical protein
MKSRILVLLITISTFGLNSCDNCEPSSLGENIIGTWEISGDIVEFQSDGMLIDENDAFIGGEFNGVALDQKSYTILNEVMVSIRAENGSQWAEIELLVTSNECDEIMLSLTGLGVEKKMVRQ